MVPAQPLQHRPRCREVFLIVFENFGHDGVALGARFHFPGGHVPGDGCFSPSSVNVPRVLIELNTQHGAGWEETSPGAIGIFMNIKKESINDQKNSSSIFDTYNI